LFKDALAKQVALRHCSDTGSETGLIESFSQVCRFLFDNPDRLSWRSKANIPSLVDETGLERLAEKYFTSYRKSDFPAMPGTVPDEMVSIVIQEAYGYTVAETERMKCEHQHAMCAENCVGALLERYLDSVLRHSGWSWCCGDFVKAVDFVRRDVADNWLALQIKNRDNTENSSSSAIRNGTPIQKWFRSFSRTGGTNWKNLPPLMQGYPLSEVGFVFFVRRYFELEKANIEQTVSK